MTGEAKRGSQAARVFGNKSRVNGWSWPPDVLQCVAWVALLYLLLYAFLCLAPSFTTAPQITSYVILSVFAVLHVVVHVIAISVNPACRTVKNKMQKGNRDVATLDRSKHKHAIEDNYCHICTCMVTREAKHCSMCNKCVHDFDHHCRWLNNCVGGENYRIFIATLSSALLGILAIFAFCLVQFVAYFTDKQDGDILAAYHDLNDNSIASSPSSANESFSPAFNTTDASYTTEPQVDPEHAQFYMFLAPVPVEAWLTLLVFTALLCIGGLCALGHLLCFHIFLLCRGLSTYDYIIQEREKAEKLAREKNVESLDTSYAKGMQCELGYDLNTERSTARYTTGPDNTGRMVDVELDTPPPRVPHNNVRPVPPSPSKAQYKKQSVTSQAHPSPQRHSAASRHNSAPQAAGDGTERPRVRRKKKRRKRRVPETAEQAADPHVFTMSNGQTHHFGGLSAADSSTGDLKAAAMRAHLDSDSGCGPSNMSEVEVTVRQSGDDLDTRPPGAGAGSDHEAAPRAPTGDAVYTPRGYNVMTTTNALPLRVRPPKHSHPRHRHANRSTTNQNADTDSDESLQEIPLALTKTAVLGGLQQGAINLEQLRTHSNGAVAGNYGHKSRKSKSHHSRKSPHSKHSHSSHLHHHHSNHFGDGHTQPPDAFHYHSNHAVYPKNQHLQLEPYPSGHHSDQSEEGYDNPAIDFSDDLTISRHHDVMTLTPHDDVSDANPESYRLAEEEEQLASARKYKPPRHKDVPPIDLSSFASDSDDADQRKKKKKWKKKHTAQV